MTDLRELIERVERAGGPDRELDLEIAWTIEPTRYATAYWNGRLGKPGTTLPKKLDGLGRLSVKSSCPAFSASLDAAVDLVERVLPGWKKQFFENYSGHWIARVSSPRRNTFSTDYMREREPDGSPNGALALILALLRAMESRDA